MRNALAPVVLTLAAAAALAGCGAGADRGVIHASGHIEATEVRLGAKVGGRLLVLPFWEGDSVKAGVVIAQLDTTDATNDLARASGDFDAADARLRLLLAGSRKEDIQRAQADLAGAEADLAGAVLDLTPPGGPGGPRHRDAQGPRRRTHAQGDARERRGGRPRPARRARGRPPHAGDRAGPRPAGGRRGGDRRHQAAHRRRHGDGASRRGDHAARRRARRGAGARGAPLRAHRHPPPVAQRLRRRAVAVADPPRGPGAGARGRPVRGVRRQGHLRRRRRRVHPEERADAGGARQAGLPHQGRPRQRLGGLQARDAGRRLLRRPGPSHERGERPLGPRPRRPLRAHHGGRRPRPRRRGAARWSG